jgi:serine/threonine-protein kinase RsbT
LRSASNGSRHGVVVVARDRGPGISDLTLAVRSGYSTSGGLGLGLPGVRRIVDDFQIESNRHEGTTVTVTKWAV